MFDTNEIDATSNVDQVNEAELDQTTVAAGPVEGQEPVEQEAKVSSIDDAITAALKTHQQKAASPEKPVQVPALKEGQVEDTINGRVLEPIKAPGSLTPQLRESWQKVPREFQQFWSDRERDMSKTMQETAAARKGFAEFSDIVKPFERQLAAHNLTPADYTRELYKSADVLWNGTPQEKAHVFVQLLTRHQPDAATLQALLAGQQPPAVQQPPRINVREEVEAMLREREEQQHTNQAQSALAQFAADPANEFYDDVKEYMGRIIDGGLVDGNSLPELLKNAYDFALKNHPQVAPVVAQRATQQPQVATRPVARPNGQIKPGLSGGRVSATTGQAQKVKSIDDAINAARAALSR